MENRTQIALATIFIMTSIILLWTCDNNSTIEAKQIKNKMDSNAPIESNLAISGENQLDEFKSSQTKNTQIILGAFKNYSEEKLNQAIALTYDEDILQEKSSEEIINDMPLLINRLKNAEINKVISETPSKISLKLKKNDSTYILDIFFFENSQKIKKMGIARLN